MAAQSKIEWTDSTFNAWIGCTKVGPGCDHCYAATQDNFRKWTPEGWGAGNPRKRTAAENWKLPLKWNASPFYQCHRCGWRGENERTRRMIMECSSCGGTLKPTRRRVFCASLSDWLDNEVPIDWRVDLLDLIARTPNLDWLLLTKRIGNWRESISNVLSFATDDGKTAAADLAAKWLDGRPPANVWLGITAVNQAEWDRDGPKLKAVPARVRFLSAEPLLAPLSLYPTAFDACQNAEHISQCPETGAHECCSRCDYTGISAEAWLDWVIPGGESGHTDSRPMHPAWVRDLRDECVAAGIALLFKQWGDWRPPLEGEEYNTALGRAQRRPAFIVNRADGTVRCFQHDTCVDGAVMIKGKKEINGNKLDGCQHLAWPAGSDRQETPNG